jgi:hypothetical protein
LENQDGKPYAFINFDVVFTVVRKNEYWLLPQPVTKANLHKGGPQVEWIFNYNFYEKFFVCQPDKVKTIDRCRKKCGASSWGESDDESDLEDDNIDSIIWDNGIWCEGCRGSLLYETSKNLKYLMVKEILFKDIPKESIVCIHKTEHKIDYDNVTDLMKLAKYLKCDQKEISRMIKNMKEYHDGLCEYGKYTKFKSFNCKDPSGSYQVILDDLAKLIEEINNKIVILKK